MDSEVRHKGDEIAMMKKEYELLKRQYKKKRGIVDQIKAIIPQLEEQTLTQEHVMRSYKEESEEIKRKIGNQQEEVELGIAQLLAQENHEKAHSEVTLFPFLSLTSLLSFLWPPFPWPRCALSDPSLSLLSCRSPLCVLGAEPSNQRSGSFRK
jgi:hypothetical protein